MEIKPIYLFYGEEEYLINKDLRFFREHFSWEDCTVEEFDGDKTDLEVILDAARTDPLFGAERLIIVTDAPWLKAAPKSEGKKSTGDEKSGEKLKKHREMLENYFSNPNENTCLVMVSSGISRSLKAVKAAEKTGKVREYAKPKKWELPAILRQHLRKAGKNILPKDLELLIAIGGEELGLLMGECDKLVMYTTGQETIEKADILAIVSSSAEANSFQLSDAFGRRDSSEVKQLAYALMENMKPWEYTALYGYMVNYLRLLIRIKEMREKGMDERAMVNATKINAYRIKMGIPSAAKYSMEELTVGLRLMLEVEYKMKSGKGNFKDTFPVALLSIVSHK